ncbi:MAG TPA: dihydrofolate reductase family protein [Brevundimonas sp.]|nr:dihydrofolate reductase family protein [Brevundimonas sp.]
MRTIRTATFVSLDGVMQAPGGPTEDTRGDFRFGGWTFTFWDEKLGQLMDVAMGEDYDLLLGRRTYEIFAAFWPHQDDEIGRTFNAVNKYVAAGPGTPLDWAHSHRLEGDVIEAVRALKATPGRDLLIQGSSELIHSLLAHDLIDQLTVLTFPVVLGRGLRLFDDSARPHAWTLESSDLSSTGVVVATYRLAGEVPVGNFADGEASDAELRRRERWAREG